MLYTQNVLIIFPWKYCEAVSIFSWKLCHLHPENIFLFQYFSLLEIAQPCTQFSFLTSGKALLTPPSYLHEPRVSEPRSFFFFFFCLQNILLLSVKPLSSLISITAKTFKLSFSPCLHKSTLVWTCFFHISHRLMLSHCLFKKKKSLYSLQSVSWSAFFYSVNLHWYLS